MYFGLIGSEGKMGKMILSVFQENGSICVLKKDLSEYIEQGKPDIMIDFSLPQALDETISLAHRFQCPLLVGTTGYSEDQTLKLREFSKEVPVFYSSNYSMGVQLLIKMLETVQPYLDDWTIGIHEIHHQTKKDKPSGTAKKLQKILKIPTEITSQRLMGFPGEHTVTLSQDNENIRITHQALSRVVFAVGVYHCSKFLLTQPSGWYTFEEYFSHTKEVKS